MNHSATLAYGLTLLDDDHTAAAHFMARGAMHFGDHTCAFVLASMLIDGDGIDQNPPLAEYILCRLCKEGFKDAYYRLGLLYLNGGLGVKKMPKRAKKIFEISAFGLGEQIAAEKLEQTDWDRLIQETEEKDKKEEKEKIELEKHKNDPTNTDFLVAASFIAGAALFCYAAYKRFFKR